jgi:hypothetical protein
MKRKEIEEKVLGLSRTVQEKIESAPFPSVVIAFFAGIVFTAFSQSVILLTIVAAVVVFALWFLAEDSTPAPFETTEPTVVPTPIVNGKDHSSATGHSAEGESGKV